MKKLAVTAFITATLGLVLAGATGFINETFHTDNTINLLASRGAGSQPHKTKKYREAYTVSLYPSVFTSIKKETCA